MINSYIDKIAHSPLFKGMSKNDIQAVFSCLGARINTYDKGEYLLTAGEEVYYIGVVLNGSIIVCKDSITGNRVVVSEINEGEVFGAIVAFSNQSQSPNNILANTKTVVVLLPKDNIIGQCPNSCLFHKTLIRNFLTILSDKAINLNKKVELLMVKSIQGRLAAYFLDIYSKTKAFNLNLPLNRNQMAQFLNLSRPSMSREMGNMKDEGIIDYHLNTVRIKDLNKLYQLIEQ